MNSGQHHKILNPGISFHRSSELAFSITSFTSSEYLPKTDYSDEEFIKDFDKYTLGKTFFDLKEFDRAAFFLEGCTSPKAYFLYMYSRYLVSYLISLTSFS